MVSLRQEQNPFMRFAVPFLKMLTLCMLWRAQFLSDFYAVFCFHQILILLPLQANTLDKKVSTKVKILILLLAVTHDKKTLIFLPLNHTRLQKVQYLLNESSFFRRKKRFVTPFLGLRDIQLNTKGSFVWTPFMFTNFLSVIYHVKY